jgi:rhodanese-related sulfurtransferase
VVPVAENLPSTPSQAPQNPQIDYPGFVQLSSDLEKLRAKRRVPLEAFQKMAKAKNTIILDTRSKAAFDEVHLADAVHLNFSDFTEQKLAKVIPNKNTRILIYCNNNFEQVSTPALLMKSAPLALNIPTFINLHGYGYENVYELADVVKLDDPRLKLAGHRKTLPLAQ